MATSIGGAAAVVPSSLSARVLDRLSPPARPRVLAAASLLAGAALPLAFAPFGLYLVAPLSLAVLFLVLEGASVRAAALRGWLWGFGAFGTGVSWVYESFQFSHIGPLVAAPLTLGFVVFLALYPALVAWLAVRVLPAGGWPRTLLLLPALWLGCEWLRGWLFTGFTWLQLGYSQVDGPLAGLAPAGGVLALSLVVALTAGALTFALTSSSRARWRVLAAVLLLWPLAGSLRGIAWTIPSGEPLSVVLVQGNMAQDRKWLPEMRQPTLDRYLGLTREHWGADIVVWPETALPDVLHRLRDFITELAIEADANGSDVVFGVPMVEPERRVFLNSLVALGDEHMLYHKRHLVPFGEYLPLDRWLRPITDYLGIPVADFAAGDAEQALLKLAGQPVAATICYEIAFGDEVARDLPQAALLLTVSNDAWFGDSIAPAQHLQIARMRALETGRWLMRATNTGISALVSPDGAVAARAPQFEVATLAGDVVPMAGATPYVRAPDWPVLLLALLLAVAGMLVGRRLHRHA